MAPYFGASQPQLAGAPALWGGGLSNSIYPPRLACLLAEGRDLAASPPLATPPDEEVGPTAGFTTSISDMVDALESLACADRVDMRGFRSLVQACLTELGGGPARDARYLADQIALWFGACSLERARTLAAAALSEHKAARRRRFG
jgi:hypothetical protein